MMQLGTKVKLVRNGIERGEHEVVRLGERWAHAGSKSFIAYRFDRHTGDVIGGGRMVEL